MDPTRDRRVLIVEDEQLSAELVRALLEDMGCHVTHAMAGDEAVHLVENEDFSLILMDLILPVMDGLEATRRIRHHSRPQASRMVPIIALTASTSREHVFACLEAGMNDYLPKPLGSGELYRMLLKWKVLEESDPKHQALQAEAARRDAFDPDRVEALRGTLERHEFDAVIAQAVSSLSEHLAVIAHGSKDPDPDIDRRAFHRIVSLSSNLGFVRLGDDARRHEQSLGAGEVIDMPLRSDFLAAGEEVLARLKTMQAA